MAKRDRTKQEDAEALDLMEADGEPNGEADPASETSLEPTDGDDHEPSELELLNQAVEEMRLLAQRKQAELENYRKRVERERSEFLKYAAVDVVREILPVLDNLERAVDAASATGEAESGQLREGVEIVQKQFRDALIRQGLEEITAQGEPFDPHIHEAVGRVETDEAPDGTVVEVFQKGYRFKDRLLRPSMVTVAQRASSESSS